MDNLSARIRFKKNCFRTVFSLKLAKPMTTFILRVVCNFILTGLEVFCQYRLQFIAISYSNRSPILMVEQSFLPLLDLRKHPLLETLHIGGKSLATTADCAHYGRNIIEATPEDGIINICTSGLCIQDVISNEFAVGKGFFNSAGRLKTSCSGEYFLGGYVSSG